MTLFDRMLRGFRSWVDREAQPEHVAPIVDRVMAEIAPQRSVCPMCKGRGVVKEIIPKSSGLILLTGCYCCSQRGFIRVVPEAA